jgi:ABC-type polysaccharide/polyol phosphate transport system ATPase subunit
MTNNIIEVNDIDKSFEINDSHQDNLKGIFTNPLSLFSARKKFDALSDVSFQVKRGEFIGILGKNGSGKSTLLKIIAGIYAPDKGEVKVHGRIVPFLELGVGFNSELTARENVYLNGTILGMTRKFITQKFQEIIEFAELQDFVDTPIKKFSSGMQVRLAFSIAIQAEADVYLLDEVLAVGDMGFQKKSLSKIKELIDRGSTVIYVSHDLGQVRKLCSRVILIKNGRKVMDGSPDNVIDEYIMSLMEGEDEERLKAATEARKLMDKSKMTITLDQIQDIIRHKNDTGDGRASILSVEIIDSSGKITRSLRVKEKFKIIMKSVIHEHIDNPIFVVSLNYDPYQPLFVLNTPRDEETIIKSFKGGEKIEVIFEAQNILAPGKYQLLVHIGDPELFGRGSGSFASFVRNIYEVEVYDPKNMLRKRIGLLDTEFSYLIKES